MKPIKLHGNTGRLYVEMVEVPPGTENVEVVMIPCEDADEIIKPYEKRKHLKSLRIVSKEELTALLEETKNDSNWGDYLYPWGGIYVYGRRNGEEYASHYETLLNTGKLVGLVRGLNTVDWEPTEKWPVTNILLWGRAAEASVYIRDGDNLLLADKMKICHEDDNLDPLIEQLYYHLDLLDDFCREHELVPITPEDIDFTQEF